NFDTSESKLRREFEVFGPVKKICLINDRNSGKPRGYAFIEYEHERDMHSAYKHADGKKIDGRRVLVDVERGRTVKGWRPRRLGGGLGGTRKGGPDENTRFSGRDEFSTGAGGGGGSERGGFRGGMEEEPPRGGGGRRMERSRSRERPRRRSRSKERPPRRSRSRERIRRSRSRERKRSREPRPERPDAEIGPEDEDSNLSRGRDKKRSRRSRSRERGERDRDRRRSRSRDRKRSKRSRSKERKFKIKEEEQQGQWVGGEEDANLNGNQDYNNDQGFGDSIRVKEEKADAYAGYGGGVNVDRLQGHLDGEGYEEGEEGEAE
ncbi:U1 small nuclear ribonucleoprotein 70 kDa, partial [Biomphalaria pfeifferi]